jgi:hypothetical protein
MKSQNLWKLSPSSLYSFVDCKACFWAENHVGRHPFTLPLRLNEAMDTKMKSRYDKFRRKKQMPDELKELKGYKLFADMEKLEDWRTKSSSLKYENEKVGYVLQGKLDEVLVDPKGRLVPSDYKSSGDPPKHDKYKYYELQLNAYGLILANKGYDVAKEAFLLHYFPKDNTNPTLNVKLNFHIDRVKIDLPKFEKTVQSMVRLLQRAYPGANYECKRCQWLEKRRKVK